MAEVGLVRLAQVAREVAESVLPLYSHPRSKRLYTQPQLVAILCLMRYEGWTYREAVVRLAEHRELREALHLARVPHFTTLQKFLKRLGEEELEGLLAEAAKRLMPKDGAPFIGACDATGLRTSRASYYFVRRLREMGQRVRRRAWLKYSLLVEVRRRAILAQRAGLGPCSDIPELPPLVASGARVARLGVEMSDAGFDWEEKHRFVREVIGALGVIPAKRGRPMREPRGYRGLMAISFPRGLYRLRNLAGNGHLGHEAQAGRPGA
jgi:hypothetical protein